MIRFSKVTTSITTLLFLGAASLGGDALGQQQGLGKQLVGTWTFVSTTSKAEGGGPMFGDNPKSLLVFTDNGRYSLTIMRSDVPKFAAKNRLKGTPEENKAAVAGVTTHFGKYSVNEADKTFTLQIEGSAYPNMVGTEQKRPFSISGDELKYTNPAPSSGGAPSQLVWKRVK
jgi:Lipocalin-like domain